MLILGAGAAAAAAAAAAAVLILLQRSLVRRNDGVNDGASKVNIVVCGGVAVVVVDVMMMLMTMTMTTTTIITLLLQIQISVCGGRQELRCGGVQVGRTPNITASNPYHILLGG